MDMFRWTVLVGGIALIVGLFAAMRLASENAESRTIVLATATLAGAALLFLVQVRFELQSSTTHDYVGVEYTVNHATASVGQWAYADVMRAQAEIGASNWLRASDAPAFDSDGKAVASDLAIFSLISFLAWQEFDWQLQRIQFAGGEVMPGSTLTQSASTDKESTVVSEADVRGQLLAAKNVFASAPLLVAMHRLLLPPKSTLRVQPRSVVIENPVCRVNWELQAPFSVTYIDPRTRTAAPVLPSGKQKYEIYSQSFKVTVTYFALHSQRRDISKYRDWTSRLVVDSHQWFEKRGTDLYEDNGVPR